MRKNALKKCAKMRKNALKKCAKMRKTEKNFGFGGGEILTNKKIFQI